MNHKKKLFIYIFVVVLFINSASIVSTYSHHRLNASETQTSNVTNKNNKTDSQKFNFITKITLSQKSISVTKGKKSVIKASISYDKNTDLEKESVVWTSKNTNIATVSKSGVINAKNSGKTYIICSSKSGNVKVRCKVVVRKPYNKISSIKLNNSHLQLGKNDVRTLKANIKYKTSKNYDNEPVFWTSSNNRIATVKNGVVKGKKNGTAYIKIKSKYTNKVARCKVTVKKTKYIAFTFDDGPGEYTDKLINALDKYHGKATFFVLGNRVNSYKKQLIHAYDLGMEIGSHTWAHKNLKLLRAREVKSEIDKTRTAIKKIIGTEPTVLRPPYGNYNKIVSKYAGVPMIYWSVDTQDWKYRNVKYVSKYIIKHAKDGEIVLLHDIHSTSVNGFIKALPSLRKKGYELVTVSELYEIKGKKMKKGKMYFGPNRDK